MLGAPNPSVNTGDRAPDDEPMLRDLAGLLGWQIRCIDGVRSVRCIGQRSKLEIPMTGE